MTSQPGPNDLTTLADVQAWLSISDPTQDADLLQSLITNASAFIATYTGRNFAGSDYTETRDGNGRDSMVLFNRPVTAIASLTVNGVSIQPSPGWPQPGYFLTDTCISLRDYIFSKGRGNITISYSAGYATVPGDLAQACIELVAYKYRLRDKTGLVSEAMMNQTNSYSQRDMPASVATVLNSYRRYF